MPPSLLDDFDPFATHPFTNTNGVLPPLPQPSPYSFPIPSTQKFHRTDGYSPASSPSENPLSSSFSSQSSSSSLGSVASMSSSTPSSSSSSPIIHTSSSPPRTQQPIFVPFRQDTSSPDLELKKAKGSLVKPPSQPRP